MVRRSMLKRLSYVGSAVMLMLAMVPIVPSGNAWADEAPACVSGPWNNLNNKLSGAADEMTITLCAGEDFTEYDHGLSASNIKNLTLDLNGNAIRITGTNVKAGNSLTIKNGTILGKNGNPLFSNSGTLTLQNITYGTNDLRFVRNNVGGVLKIESGNYSGATTLFYGDGATEISGGTFDRDVNSGIASGYAAYKSGNAWVVETKLTNENIAAPGTITLKEGEVFDVASVISLPVGSTTGLSYYSRNNNVASINYHGVNSEGSNGLLGVKNGTTSIAVRPLYDTSLVKNINVKVESGLKNIEIEDISMLQEDEKTVPINNVYYVDRASGVSYEVMSVSNDEIEATINGNELKVKTDGIEPGNYTVRVAALVDGERTNTTKDVNIVVDSIFTNFSLEQADANDKITIKENQWFKLKISSVSENVIDINNVRVKSVDLISGSSVMHVREDRIAGDKKGVGTGKIAVTAEYTSENNTYTLTKEFDVEVISALQKIAIREADDVNNTGIKYGSLAGETNSVMLDQNSTKDLKISVYQTDAAVNYSVVSSDTSVADISLNEDTGEFTIAARKAGEVEVIAIVTPKNAVNGVGVITNSFTVKVYPILISVNAESYDITVYEDEIDKKIAVSRVVEEAIKDDVVWTFEGYDDEVIEVADDGTITPKKDGETFVTLKGTFTSPLGRVYVVTTEQPIKVTVKSRLESISAEELHIKVHSKGDFNITVEEAGIDPEYSYEFDNSRIAKISSTGGIRGMNAGDTDVTISATHFGKTVSTTTKLHVYEMVTPEHRHYYGATGSFFNVKVGDKNTNAYTRTSVDNPRGIMVFGNNVIAFLPGVYNITYTDYMANGEVVGEYTATFTVFNVERETVVVEKGKKIELDPHSEWSTSKANDETSNYSLVVKDGKAVFKTNENTELGTHEVTLIHNFGHGANEVVKRVNVIVYEVDSDISTDPDGVTADTLKEYIENMFDGNNSWTEWMDKINKAREMFGDGIEAFLAVAEINNALMNGETISTHVEVIKIDAEDVDAEVLEIIDELNVDGVDYYDVSVWMTRNGIDFGKLHQLNDKITVALMKVSDPATGYTRQYIVVRQHAGEEPEVLVEGVDFYIENGTLYVISDKFSTFAVAYKDTLLPVSMSAPDTGKNISENGSASVDVMVTVLGVVAAITLAGAVVLAKRR